MTYMHCIMISDIVVYAKLFLIAKKLYCCIVMLLDSGALYMHLYLLLCSKVRCLPDVYLTHSWVNVFQVPQRLRWSYVDVPEKAKVSAAEVSIALHGLSGDRFPGRRAAL